MEAATDLTTEWNRPDFTLEQKQAAIAKSISRHSRSSGTPFGCQVLPGPTHHCVENRRRLTRRDISEGHPQTWGCPSLTRVRRHDYVTNHRSWVDLGISGYDVESSTERTKASSPLPGRKCTYSCAARICAML